MPGERRRRRVPQRRFANGPGGVLVHVLKNIGGLQRRDFMRARNLQNFFTTALAGQTSRIDDRIVLAR